MSWSNKRRTRRFPSAAFTLVELLAVSSIIGILIAVTLPAVQSAREASRRCECKNNLKQLALACLSHHDVHGHFPTGGWGWYWTGDADRGFGKDQPGGWIFNTLPYFEQYDLYDLASDGAPDKLKVPQLLGASKIIQTPLSIINCPSRRANRPYPMTANEGGKNDGFFNSFTPSTAGRSDYAINSGHMFNEWPFQVLGKGPRNYLEAAAWTAGRYWGVDQAPFNYDAPTREAMTGISYERSIVSMRQITRGLSNTYLVGERYIPQADYETGSDNGDNETWCTGFNNDNYRKTGRWQDGQIVESVPIPDTNADMPDSGGRFGSAHPGMWNVSFCDGSVREMSYDIDWQVHRDTGNRYAD